MSQRNGTNRAKDARMYKDTVTKTKVANLPGKALRGGIRL